MSAGPDGAPFKGGAAVSGSCYWRRVFLSRVYEARSGCWAGKVRPFRSERWIQSAVSRGGEGNPTQILSYCHEREHLTHVAGTSPTAGSADSYAAFACGNAGAASTQSAVETDVGSGAEVAAYAACRP